MPAGQGAFISRVCGAGYAGKDQPMQARFALPIFAIAVAVAALATGNDRQSGFYVVSTDRPAMEQAAPDVLQLVETYTLG